MTKFNEFSKKKNKNVGVYKMMNDILTKKRIKDAEKYQATHGSMNSIWGKYILSKDDINWIFENDIDPNIGLLEVPQHYSMLRVDLDFKSDNLDETKDMKLITLNAVKQFNQFLEENELDTFDKTAFVMTKPPYIKQDKNNKQIKKFGVHIQYPKIFLNKEDFNRFENYFKDKVDGFDCIATKNWLIYGQQKDEYSGTYTLDYVLDEYLNEKTDEELKQWFVMYKLDGKKIDVDNPPLKKILSINHYSSDYSGEFKVKINDELVQESKKIVQKEYKEKTKEQILKELSGLVNLLKSERSDNRSSWIKVLWALKNTDNSEECKDIFIEFSRKSDKFHKDSVEYAWYSYKVGTYNLSIGSLWYWAKEDNPDKFEKWKIENKTLNFEHFDTHNGIAELFKDLYGEENIRIVSHEKGNFYHWNAKTLLWENEPFCVLGTIIANKVLPYIENNISTLAKELSGCDKDGVKVVEEKMKRTMRIIKNLKTNTFKDSCAKEYKTLPFDKTFVDNINKKPSELPIKGGLVIDLKTKIVRKRTQSDYWDMEMNVSYNEAENDYKNAIKFFSSISCGDPKLIDYHRRLWGYALTGEITDRSMHVMWGKGRNGKSTLINMLKKILGTFQCTLSDKLLIKTEISTGANPEYVPLTKSRLGIFPESERGVKMKNSLIKTITGGDEITFRRLYSEQSEFRTQTKLFLPTQHKPVFDVDDQAMIDRMKLLPFPARFPKEEEDKEEADKNTKFINHLYDNCVDEFFSYLVEGAYDWYAGQSLNTCEAMKESMSEYLDEIDDVKEFVNEMFDIISEEEYSLLKTSERKNWITKGVLIWSYYCNHCKEANVKPGIKKDFYKRVDNLIGSIISHKTRYYLCREKDRIFETENNDDDDDNNGLPPM